MRNRKGANKRSGERRRRRADLHVRQEGCCFWCEKPIALEATTLDELVPRSKGGTDHWNNLVVSCASCNTKRGDTMAPMWAMYLVRLREVWAVRGRHSPAESQRVAE